MKRTVIALALLVGVTYGALLGQQRFTLKGRVLDEQTHEPMQGATVSIEGTRLGANADLNGAFVIRGIPESSIRFKVTYIGYQPQVFTHDFKAAPSPDLTLNLRADVTEMDEVVIEGKAQGQYSAFLQQKNAENIKNVLAAEQIQSFPDMNAAEAIQRVPGITLQRDQGEGRYVQLRGTPPELTNFNINGEQIPSPEGDVRFVGLDIIPTDQIEFIEVTKVLLPDMDGDGIGGNVNIVTKTPDGDKPDIRATFASGYNNLRGKGNYQGQFAYGQRYGKFGFNLNASYYLNNMGSDNMEYKYAKGPFFGNQGTSQGVDNYFVQYREFQLRHYELTRSRLGISPTWDFQLNEHHYFYLRGMYNRFSDRETRRRLVYDLDDALSETYYLYGGIVHDIRARTKIQDVATVNLGGEHDFGKVEIDYMFQYALARENRPDHMEAVFENPGQAIAIRFADTDTDYPVAEFPREADTLNAYNYGEYDLDELLFEESLVTDNNLTARLNIKVPYLLNGNNDGYIKFGGKIRSKDKERDITAQVFGAYFEEPRSYPDVGPKLSITSVVDDFYEGNLLGKGYVMSNMPAPARMRDFFDFYPHHFIFDRTETKIKTFGEDYTAEEDIYAAYVMFRHNWRDLMVLGGVRYEQTDINYNARRILTERGRYRGLDTLEDRRTQAFFLPQLQLKYTPEENLNLRAAISYSYARPNFEDVLPYREEDQDEVRFGNPDLDYPISMNLDLLAERYVPGGVISGGLFYKEIDNFVFYYKRFAHEGDPEDYGLVEITKAINGLNASVYGAEVQAQFMFSFLPGILKKFGIYANYTYTHSTAFINQRFPANYSGAIVVFGEDDLEVFSSATEREEITLPGQAQHTTNLALIYDDKKFYTRITANFHDDFLFQLGADEDLDEYYGSAWRVDLTANYALTPNLRLFVDAINLTDAPLKFYLGKPENGRIQQQEFYSWWGRIGIKLSF